jgi:Spy/CpxP family protein refolding chaperone
MDETRKNGHANKLQLHQLSYSSAYTEDQATALIEQSLAAHKTQALQEAQLDRAIFKVLTAEQQTAVQAKIAKLGTDKPF